jgi:membrane protease YdiL (CAAX protease family)
VTKGTTYTLTACWIVLAVWHYFSGADEPGPLRGGLFLMALGLSTIGWGWLGIKEGEILIKRKTASRKENPTIFWTVTILFHFVLGVILTGAGLWYTLQQPGP